eukprot:8653245-Prorocentrum_lima.AAC.1
MFAAGLRDIKTNMYLKKPTKIWASDERLIRDIRTLQCNGRHPHIPIEGGDLPGTHMDMGVCLLCSIRRSCRSAGSPQQAIHISC